MMKKFVKILLLLFLTFSICLRAAVNDFTITGSEGRQYRFQSKNIHGGRFIAFYETVKVFENVRFNKEKNLIGNKEFYIKVMHGSFFIALCSEKECLASQMIMPAVKTGNTLYVPAESFFRSLNFLGITDMILPEIENQEKRNHSKYSNTVFRRKAPLGNEEFRQKLEIKQLLKESGLNPKKGEIPSEPPNKYSLPKNLIIEEKQK